VVAQRWAAIAEAKLLKNKQQHLKTNPLAPSADPYGRFLFADKSANS
jgi:hypothetical protein